MTPRPPATGQYYITLFRWQVSGWKWTDWTPPEVPIATCMRMVVEQIGEYADVITTDVLRYFADGDGGIKVILADLDTGTSRDCTEEALLAFADASMNRGEGWPWWLIDMAPEYARGAA